MTQHVRCGGCGNDTFKLGHYQPYGERKTRLGGGPFTGALVVTCTKCGSRSSVKTTTVCMDVEHLEGAGAICGGYKLKRAQCPRCSGSGLIADPSNLQSVDCPDCEP